MEGCTGGWPGLEVVYFTDAHIHMTKVNCRAGWSGVQQCAQEVEEMVWQTGLPQFLMIKVSTQKEMIIILNL